ncbi:MAG: hypothetical protein NVSMB52_04610 [Chloroflexota bacterium]
MYDDHFSDDEQDVFPDDILPGDLVSSDDSSTNDDVSVPEADGPRSWVDVTVHPEEMVRLRAYLRRQFVHQFHLLKLASRANRKAGNHDVARRQDASAERCVFIIWSLRTPQDSRDVLETTVDNPDEHRHTLDDPAAKGESTE